jgi:hypothetical protein
MAPSVDVDVVEIYIWNHFTAVKNGVPLISGRLHTYQANTTTPRAAYADPWLTSEHSNPLVLDDQGSADIWLGPGFYHLRLEDAEGVQLWDILSFSFPSTSPPPDPGEKIVGSADTTVLAQPGASVIPIPDLVPLGFRAEGTTYTITTAFGTSQGLTGLLLGDSVVNSRWFDLDTLAAGTTGGQVSFRSESQPIAAIPYQLLLAAKGGLFDSTGAIHIRAYYSALPADVP